MPSSQPAGLDEWIEFAIRVREVNDAVPLTKRICIGGDLFLTTVQQDVLQSRRIYRFPDYADMWNAMVDLRITSQT